jgi:NADH:ubiquinone oxidoreductase subunit 6 (subunit J)
VKICIAVMVLGVVLTPTFFVVWVDHFELYSTGWDVFLPLAALSGLATVAALVGALVLSFRRPNRKSNGDV